MGCLATYLRYSYSSTAMLYKTCYRRFLGSLKGAVVQFSDMPASQTKTQFRSSHWHCRRLPSHHGASCSSARGVQSLAITTSADSFYAVGTSFQQLGLSQPLADAVHRSGFTEPAHIQVRRATCLRFLLGSFNRAGLTTDSLLSACCLRKLAATNSDVHVASITCQESRTSYSAPGVVCRHRPSQQFSQVQILPLLLRLEVARHWHIYCQSYTA